MHIESEQVRLRLSGDKDVLEALRKRRRMDKDEKGQKLILQFDSRAFEFRPGRAITVNKTVADALIRSSAIIVGDDLTGEIRPALERLEIYRIGDEESGGARKSATTCSVCGTDCLSLPALAKHLEKAHIEERPDLYTKPPAPEWEVDSVGEEK